MKISFTVFSPEGTNVRELLLLVEVSEGVHTYKTLSALEYIETFVASLILTTNRTILSLPKDSKNRSL